MKRSYVKGTIAERLLAYASPCPITGCWWWTGHCDDDGYGRLEVDGADLSASRLSFETFVRPLGPGEQACHSCDQPTCMNPAHLFAGTNAQNVADCVSKGRHSKGSRNGRAKLNEAQVAELRKMPGRLVDVARAFGVSVSTVSLIRRGRLWS